MNFLHFFNIKKKRNLKLGFLVRKINLGGNWKKNLGQAEEKEPKFNTNWCRIKWEREEEKNIKELGRF